MPPDSFKHLIDSQVRTMELATGIGSRPLFDRPREYRSMVYHRPRDGNYPGRGRGRGRGGSTHRGTRGRAIPGGQGFNRRPRYAPRAESDVRSEITEAPASSSRAPANPPPPIINPGRSSEPSFRETSEQSSGESVTSGATTGTSELDLRRVPADEVESAASWALANGMRMVTVESDGDDDMDAEGEPAGEVEEKQA
jgi:hypothetical protein